MNIVTQKRLTSGNLHAEELDVGVGNSRQSLANVDALSIAVSSASMEADVAETVGNCSPSEEMSMCTVAMEADFQNLLNSINGRWVLYRTGILIGNYATEPDAYAVAEQRGFIKGTFLIDRISKYHPCNS